MSSAAVVIGALKLISDVIHMIKTKHTLITLSQNFKKVHKSTLSCVPPNCAVIKIIHRIRLQFTHTGWRPVVAAYQWWPFAFCTRSYAFVAP